MASIEPITMEVELAGRPTTTDTTPAAQKKFEVKKLNAVTLWSYDIISDTCAICHNQNMDPCIECQAKHAVVSTEECNVAWGACNHAFHFHCISRWVRIRQKCPLCDRDWDYQKLSS